MKDNNFTDIPDLNQVLRFTEQYEEYKYLRVWGLFLLIDAIVVLLSHLFFNTFITGIFYKFPRDPSFFFNNGLRIIQYFILLILLLKIGGTNRRTRLKLGKIYVAPHWAFFCGLIGIKALSIIFDFIITKGLIFLLLNYDLNFFLISYPINLSITMTSYYIFMKKMILKHDFKEIKNIIFFLLGWIGFIIITVFFLNIDEYFGLIEIPISITNGEVITSIDIPIYEFIVNYFLILIFIICEVIIGIIAFKKSKNLLSGEIGEIGEIA